ncbi:MAG: hypothetical protein WBC26_07740 [Alphaproteobacteria bacterium]
MERDMEEAVVLAAQIAARYGDKYLPLFERLESELRNVRAGSALMSRAIEIAASASD